ncbi:MAG: FAA hydrolase family protein [Clostridia bacterium]|nr:FAA hydrolase family protein [Clostridia bacterium]NCC42151.1 FAA hydrolase family protein [Clostridia bacterium]
MRLYTIEKENCQEIAVAFGNEENYYVLRENGIDYSKMQDLIEDWNEELSKKIYGIKDFGNKADMETYKICAPIPRPRQDVICLGINYYEHAREAAGFSQEAFGGERPRTIYFSKRCSQAPGTGDGIPSYEGLVDSLDYEAELGVVLGKDVKDTSKELALASVFGYTIINDISARNLQTAHKQWLRGKSLDGFTPMGPCIVTADEIPDPQKLDIRCYVNEELRQNSNTKLQIQDVAGAISELSEGMTLLAGTIIATGTPAGVGMGFSPPRFLKKGDKVRCEIEGIGCLENVIC